MTERDKYFSLSESYMKLLITLVIIFVVLDVNAQTMPSSDASSLIKGINTPVNLYNGTASVSVPLYEAQANNGAKVPVSLVYNTGGIKVNEVAGAAGLGWRLVAGGTITRVMRSEPDEHKPFVTALNFTNVKDYLDGDRSYDFEKDQFYFSYPGGIGRFIFEGDVRANTTHANIHTLPSSDVKIEFVKSNDLSSYFIITDTYGTRFYFGQNTSSREVTKTNYKDNRDNTTYDPDNEREFISSWQLDRIIYANQPSTDDITFLYTPSTIVDEQVDQSVPFIGDYYDCITDCTNDTQCNDCDQFSDSNNINTFRSEIGVKYVSSILFPKGRINLSYSNTRTDLTNGKRLTSVSLLDHNGLEVSTTELVQSYFNSSSSYFKGGTYGSCTSEKCYRLKLDRIEKDGLKTFEFDYTSGKEFHPNGSDKYQLPPRDSYYIDHWGFYCGGPHQGAQGAIYTFHPSASFLPNFASMKGIDKSPSEYSKANLLNKITFSTGGYREFTFDKHPTDLDFWGNDSGHGGVRVESIKDFDENDNVVSHTTYQYFSPNSSPDPGYRFDVPQGGQGIFGKSKTQIYDLRGPVDGYDEVHETNAFTGAQTRHYFISLSDRVPAEAVKQSWILDVGNSSLSLKSPQPTAFYSPYVMTSLEYYDLGIEDKIVTYDEAGKKVMERENFYSHESASDYSVTNRNLYFSSSTGQTATYTVSLFQVKSRNIFLDSTIERSYDNNGILFSEVTTTKTYDGTYETLPKRIESKRTGSTGGESFNSIQELYYPFEWPLPASQLIPSNGALTTMISKNMIAIPVASVTEVKLPEYSGYKVSNVELTTFYKPNGLPQPRYRYVLELEQPGNWTYTDMRLTNQMTYNSSGLLESQKGTDGIETVYQYDSRGYVTSETIKPDPGNSSLDQTTSYTYEPLVGLKTVTSPTGETMTYEYDSRNRLYLTRDSDNNIVERYRYNYGSETNEISASIAVSGYNKTGQSMTLKATDVQMYGSGTFHWDLDGTTKTGQTVTHTFSSAGDKDIKLSVVNPEYDAPLNVTRYIPIYDSDWGTSEIGGNTTPDVGTIDSYFIFTTPGAHTCSDLQDFTYRWRYRNLPSGTFQDFSGNDSAIILWNFTSLTDIEFEVTVTDQCGVSLTKTMTVDVQFSGFGGGF